MSASASCSAGGAAAEAGQDGNDSSAVESEYDSDAGGTSSTPTRKRTLHEADLRDSASIIRALIVNVMFVVDAGVDSGSAAGTSSEATSNNCRYRGHVKNIMTFVMKHLKPMYKGKGHSNKSKLFTLKDLTAATLRLFENDPINGLAVKQGQVRSHLHARAFCGAACARARVRLEPRVLSSCALTVCLIVCSHHVLSSCPLGVCSRRALSACTLLWRHVCVAVR